MIPTQEEKARSISTEPRFKQARLLTGRNRAPVSLTVGLSDKNASNYIQSLGGAFPALTLNAKQSWLTTPAKGHSPVHAHANLESALIVLQETWRVAQRRKPIFVSSYAIVRSLQKHRS